MKYRDLTGKTIQQAFLEYHRNNPRVYEHFKRLAFEAIRAGKKKISAKLICNVIRWEVLIKTVDLNLFELNGSPVIFKLNDIYTAYYGRLFAQDYPEHAEKLEFRRIRSL